MNANSELVGWVVICEVFTGEARSVAPLAYCPLFSRCDECVTRGRTIPESGFEKSLSGFERLGNPIIICIVSYSHVTLFFVRHMAERSSRTRERPVCDFIVPLSRHGMLSYE